MFVLNAPWWQTYNLNRNNMIFPSSSIIKSRGLHGVSPSLSLSLSLSLSSPSSSSSIPIIYSPARSSRVYPVSAQSLRKSLLVDQHWHVHLQVSMRERRWWVRPCFYQQCPACRVLLTWMVCEMGGKWQYSCFLWAVASGICSRQRAAFLCSSYRAFPLGVLLASMWCIHMVIWTQLQLRKKNFYFIG